MLLVEADVKGLGIGEGVRPWNGAKVMTPFTPAGGKTQYPQTPNETGSFDWKTWSMVRDFGQPAYAIRWSYPGYINGVWWDKEQLRVALKPWIDFQLVHPDAPILVGEFSCILWSKGADKWSRDCIELFEEYGWSWCYHAYREWPPWDVEYTNAPDWATGKWLKAPPTPPASANS